MRFTYEAYGNLLNLLKSNGYEFKGYSDWNGSKKCVIMRHDIDDDIGMAYNLAAFERDGGVSSTFFVILTSDLYNVFSKKNADLLKEIADLGHEIGLHFDEMRYPEIIGDVDGIREKIIWEAGVLSEAVGKKICTVSMHRPSKNILDADIEIPGILNSYSKTYFKDFKYLSDSRRRWRESVEDIIAGGQYDRLHILTHAFWYHEKELGIHDSLEGFINRGNWHRYKSIDDNFTNLDEVLTGDEILGYKGDEIW